MKKISFYSTNRRAYSVNRLTADVPLRTAVLNGLAPDGGLYLPTELPRLPQPVLAALPTLSFQEIAFHIAQLFTAGEIPNTELSRIIEAAYDFDVPLAELEKETFVCELFHGQTLAFKDFGARFMAQLVGHFAAEEKKSYTVLVATSGDTGSAVASAFSRVAGTRVVILYPSGKVSRLQEQQLTTTGDNVTALEVSGDFDDCQRLVKEAFADAALRAAMNLTSANSINIARLIPQSFYYAYTASVLLKTDSQERLARELCFSVPSGNFGNLTGGLLAKKIGVPIHRFIAATNLNDSVPRYLETGRFAPASTHATLSTAMDVGNPSNFARLLALSGDEVSQMRRDITGVAVTDAEVQAAMKKVYGAHRYILEPHTAVGIAALEKVRRHEAQKTLSVVLATAHPAKFLETTETTLGISIPLPDALLRALQKEKHSTQLAATYADFKNFLLSTLS